MRAHTHTHTHTYPKLVHTHTQCTTHLYTNRLPHTPIHTPPPIPIYVPLYHIYSSCPLLPSIHTHPPPIN